MMITAEFIWAEDKSVLVAKIVVLVAIAEGEITILQTYFLTYIINCRNARKGLKKNIANQVKIYQI